MRVRGDREAFGAPGMAPRWSHANKDGIGTAYSGDSRVWYTLFRGSVTEVYYPFIDHPQLRDLQYLVTDGATFFHEDRRQLVSETERIGTHALGFRIVQRDPDGRYAIEKEVIAAPHLPVVLQRTAFRVAGDRPLRLFALCAPHLDIGGWDNTGYVIEHVGRTFLAAERNGTWLALGASVPFRAASVGFVGASDGWTDLHTHRSLAWTFDRATRGNVALTGEIALPPSGEFTLALSFGEGLAHALAALLEALGTPCDAHRDRFVAEWDRPMRSWTPSAGHRHRSALYHASASVLLAHEDKTFPGAFVASLSIPWGNARSEEAVGGYHLVWTRDAVRTATGLLAAGDTATPRRTLIYLATVQRDDGRLPQNSWLDGTPYWQGLQLDEVAHPILLAWKLERADALADFDPMPMVRAAAGFLVHYGPATGQERWEETAGYSPSTLAVHIAALIAAGEMLRRRADPVAADLVESYADFLESHLETWTVTRTGTLVPGHPTHYVRILPASPYDPTPPETLDDAEVALANQPPGAPDRYPARAIVDGGFLELVRYGVRSALDPIVVSSVEVIDAVLRTETPAGPAWHRYNHDGYGDRDDGGAFDRWGVGRLWPLLTGERGGYELAAGRDPAPFVRTLEGVATATGLLAEQVWDGPDDPPRHLFRGRPTGAAMPLAWAHAEYLTLVRSVEDGRPFDRIPAVEARYARSGRRRPAREVWKFRRQPRSIRPGTPVRFLAEAPFRLHVSTDGWASVRDLDSTPTSVGVHWVDLPASPPAGGRIDFTFYWPEASRWEGRDFRIDVADAPAGGPGA